MRAAQGFGFGGLFLTGGVLMGAHRGRVNHEPFEIGFLQSLEYILPEALPGPSVKALKNGVVLSEVFRLIRPGSARASDPEYGVNEEALSLAVRPGSPSLPGSRSLIRCYCSSVSS